MIANPALHAQKNTGETMIVNPGKSSISKLPDEVRRHIEKRLAEGRMTLDELISDLRVNFPEEALPSRSAVHRYGQKLEKRLSAIRASTEAAKIISEHAGDKEDARSEALTAMIQSELFESIMALQEADEMEPTERVKLLAEAAKNIATLTRSSVTLKKYQQEARETARKELLAEQEKRLEEITVAKGLSDEESAFWRHKFLGVS